MSESPFAVVSAEGDKVRWNDRENDCEVTGIWLGYLKFTSHQGVDYLLDDDFPDDLIIRKATPRQEKVADVDELYWNGTQILGDSDD